MKKGTEYLKSIISGITDDNRSVSDTLITIDFGGCLIIDSFEKIIDYNRQCISVQAAGKGIEISGDNLVITGCDRNIIRIKGDISGLKLE